MWRGARVLTVTAAFAACDVPAEPPVGAPGSPLEGLLPEQRSRFLEGQRLFDRDFTPEEGLGPSYNQLRCSSCHDVPSRGGSGVELVRKATRWLDGRCDLLEEEGGDNIQQRAIEALRQAGTTDEKMPASATHIVNLTAPALYGLGLVEAIPESTLLALADPHDADGDGISGRQARTADGRVARFGQKGDASTLRDFIAGALLQEMGLTSVLHPADLTVNGRSMEDFDGAPDPEVSEDALDLLVAYVRYLSPVAPAEPVDAADSSDVARGFDLFHDVGCASCHVAVLETGPSEDPVLDRRSVLLYSDLLLHDLGDEVADVCGPGATPSEIRTARLNGLRFRPMLMHDGRGTRLDAVIERHGGEAAVSRDRFGRLAPDARAALLRFLETL